MSTLVHTGAQVCTLGPKCAPLRPQMFDQTGAEESTSSIFVQTGSQNIALDLDVCTQTEQISWFVLGVGAKKLIRMHMIR